MWDYIWDQQANTCIGMYVYMKSRSRSLSTIKSFWGIFLRFSIRLLWLCHTLILWRFRRMRKTVGSIWAEHLGTAATVVCSIKSEHTYVSDINISYFIYLPGKHHPLHWKCFSDQLFVLWYYKITDFLFMLCYYFSSLTISFRIYFILRQEASINSKPNASMA